MDKTKISNLIVTKVRGSISDCQMVDISFINILVCEMNNCTLGHCILNEYKGMDVKEESQIYFSRKAP